MRYGKVIELAQMAKDYGLFPNPFLKNLLMCALLSDDEVLVNDAEEYIGLKMISKMSTGYRGNGIHL